MSEVLGYLQINVVEASSIWREKDGSEKCLWDDDVTDGFVKGAF